MDSGAKSDRIALEQIGIQVAPSWIHPLDQFDFPVALPFLDRLFPRDRAGNRGILLEPDQIVDMMPLAESFDDSLPVLPHAANKIRRHAQIERASPSARKQVDARLLHDGMKDQKRRAPVARLHALQRRGTP